MKVLIPFDEARKIELDNTEVLGREKIFSLDALNRILAEDIVSDIVIPPWDNSAVDGYGINGDYNEGEQKKIVKTIAAGEIDSMVLNSDEAIKIMTGAPIPKGVDRVIMVEDTKIEGDKVILNKKLGKWKNIRKKGEDLKKGRINFTERYPA